MSQKAPEAVIPWTQNYQFKILGFDVLPGSWEPEGYLRWRRRFEGDDRQLVRFQQKDAAEPRAVALAPTDQEALAS